MKKEYLIVGSDNFWYASGLKSLKLVKQEIENIKENPESYGEEGGKLREEVPETLYVYKAEEVKRIENELN